MTYNEKCSKRETLLHNRQYFRIIDNTLWDRWHPLLSYFSPIESISTTSQRIKNAVECIVEPRFVSCKVVIEIFFYWDFLNRLNPDNTTSIDSTSSRRIEYSLLITAAFPLWKKESFLLWFFPHCLSLFALLMAF